MQSEKKSRGLGVEAQETLIPKVKAEEVVSMKRAEVKHERIMQEPEEMMS